MKKYIVINEFDNVMVALEDFEASDIVNGVKILIPIKQGHKIALRDIKKGEDIIKYGYPIGKATIDILKGQWVHTHNVKTNLDDKVDFNYEPKLVRTTDVSPQRKVNVYLRSNGEVGIRNEIIVLPTVGCVTRQAKRIVDIFLSRHPHLEVDAIYSLAHPYGCSQMGDDHENTKQTLQNIAKHPNYGGVLVLGLGCENNQISEFKHSFGEYDPSRIKFLVSQEVKDEIEVGLKLLEEIYDVAKLDKRSLQDISKIKIGLECGGSDGLSGITANPLIGHISDYFIGNGATAVLTEIPEMFGAEKVLLDRCETKEIFDELLTVVNDFKDYYQSHNQVIYENPSPGNKAGGITTLEEKSLGCVQKSGSSNVVGVLNYTDILSKRGLNIISAPGNDLVATTTLGMCGCQLVLFSTGRGTPYGGFIPTIKISTNTALFNQKRSWIDFNSGDVNINNYQEKINQFINYIIEVIEGKQTQNEINDFREISIFKKGVIL